jgi:hypothetical protein
MKIHLSETEFLKAELKRLQDDMQALAAQPAPVQEPVAWGKPTDEMVQAATDEYDEWAVDNKGTTECIRAMLVKALKATPPAAPEPLTDEQADAIALDVMGFAVLDKEQRETARMIIRNTEAAHGITGKGQP